MEKLKVLLIEDVESDAELVKYHVSTLDYNVEYRHVKTEKDFLNTLTGFDPDIVISDYNLNGYNGMEALAHVRKTLPMAPFILVTGTLGEELAVQIMRQGASDFILKGKMADLPRAVVRALREAKEKRAKVQAEEDLRHTLTHLEDQVVERTKTLQKANKQLEEYNKDISDSINYAKHIQNAFVPTIDPAEHGVNDAFVFSKPRDTLSGDFHWVHRDHVNDCTYFALGDCTGHGVPGALMTILSVQLLEQGLLGKSIKRRPKDVVMELDAAITDFLGQAKSGSQLNDGLEMALFRIDHAEKRVEFTTIGRPVYLFSSRELQTFKGDKSMVGGSIRIQTQEAEDHRIDYQSGDRMYVFSDGYEDQFGGERDKKMLRKRKIALLAKIQSKPFSEHAHLLEQYFIDWKGDGFQVDDVIALGLEF